MSIQQQKFCTTCGQPVPANGQFCGACGSPLANDVQAQTPPPPAASPVASETGPATATPDRKHRIAPIAILVALVLLAAGAGTWLWLSNQSAGNLTRKGFDQLAQQSSVAGFVGATSEQPWLTPRPLSVDAPDMNDQCAAAASLEKATVDKSIYYSQPGAQYSASGVSYSVTLERAADAGSLAKLITSEATCFESLKRVATPGSNAQDGTNWLVITDPAGNPPGIIVAFRNVLLLVTTGESKTMPSGADIGQALRKDVLAVRS
jgi:hypothetical protein